MALSFTGMIENELSSSELSVFDRGRDSFAVEVGRTAMTVVVESGGALTIFGRDIAGSITDEALCNGRELVLIDLTRSRAT